MKAVAIAGAESMRQVLQDEVRRSAVSRYDHRLHGVLLVSQGLSCSEVGRLLGKSVRSVQYWVHRFEQDGVAGLIEGQRPGRPGRLDRDQLRALSALLREPPSAVGLNARFWSGKLLAQFLEREWEMLLGPRQCQRLCQRLGPLSKDTS
ncbi:MAG: transposase [Hydrocarboniphaga sp.]|uniref:helix-turn-helix domain-containing protein n=1 Tax=Hydrocarboniphaga sp. TaxID=2033016 RepID=UPI00261A0443|nr:helix-turn-helix domain-containing protein [Hydrocarboniphaga sp.]MDB5971458.1 transposase [Hydrocarboniphaga sp.]